MVDLTTQGAHQFWKDYSDPMIYRVVSFMESVEHWTLDGNPEFEAAIKKLGNTLEGITKFELKLEDHYIKVANSLRMNRTLRLLQAIDSTHPGSASRLLMYAEEHSKSMDDAPGLFLRRNIVFERLRLLGRVFSSERFSLIVKAMEHEDAD